MPLPRIPRPLPDSGFAVSVDKISSGFRLLGFIPGYSHNDLSPQLVLYPARMAVKVLNTSHHEYTDLRQVDYKSEGFLRSASVVFHLADHTEYYIHPSSMAVLRDLLRFCHERGVPLTPAARQEAQAS